MHYNWVRIRWQFADSTSLVLIDAATVLWRSLEWRTTAVGLNLSDGSTFLPTTDYWLFGLAALHSGAAALLVPRSLRAGLRYDTALGNDITAPGIHLDADRSAIAVCGGHDAASVS